MAYPGAVRDPDTGAWISDAEVAEIGYTAFTGRPEEITARLVVRRVKDANHRDALFPVWRHHPFLTNSTLSTVEADITHRRHAIIETVFADLINGPLAPCPPGVSAPTAPGSSARPSPTTCCARPESSPVAPTALPGARHCAGVSSTSPPDWPVRNGAPSCTCPPTGPGRNPGLRCGAERLD